jgi:hypothetical protein
MRGNTAQRAEARKIMLNKFGPESIKGKVVHHKDGNPWNNDISNLEVLNIKEHRKKHAGVAPSVPCEEIIIRNVPESVRRELKSRAAKDGKTMQGLVLELITRYVVE